MGGARKWLAGWLSRAGGALLRLADRVWPPYPERERGQRGE